MPFSSSSTALTVSSSPRPYSFSNSRREPMRWTWSGPNTSPVGVRRMAVYPTKAGRAVSTAATAGGEVRIPRTYTPGCRYFAMVKGDAGKMKIAGRGGVVVMAGRTIPALSYRRSIRYGCQRKVAEVDWWVVGGSVRVACHGGNAGKVCALYYRSSPSIGGRVFPHPLRCLNRFS